MCIRRSRGLVAALLGLASLYGSTGALGAERPVLAFAPPPSEAAAKHLPVVQELLKDPSIRGHVGLSENSWDFSSPEAIPGFGPITNDAPQRSVLARSSD